MEENTSLGKGILGAIIGSLPGVILWVILGYFGFTAAIVGFVIAAGIIIGYGKGNGPLNTAGLVSCVVIMIVAVYLGVHLSWSAVFFEWNPNLIDSVFGLYRHLALRDLAMDFAKSLGMGYLFAFLGGAGMLGKMAR